MTRIRLFLAIFAITASQIGCGGGGGGSSGAESNRELLRVVHAAPNLGKITLLQNDKAIYRDLAYGKSSEYFDIEETATGGTTSFAVRVDPEFALPTATTKEAVAGTYFKTLLITESSGAPVLTFINDVTTQEVEEGDSRIRFINANAAVAKVDIYVTSPSTSLTGRTPNVAGLELNKASAFFPIEPAEYRVRIAASATTTTGTAAGTAAATEDTTVTTVFDDKSYTVEQGGDLTFLFLEKKGGGKPYISLTNRGGDR